MTRIHRDIVTTACKLIVERAHPPAVESLAATVGMSPSHFHRVFKSMTGLTPKAYAAAHRARRVRESLKRKSTVTAAIYDAGFNSNGRFYEKSSKVLGMTPTRFRAGGAGTTIRFAVGECSLGAILVAATDVGVCFIALDDDPQHLVRELQDRFPRATLVGGDAGFEKLVAKVVAYVERPSAGLDLPLDIQGTAFQQRVWNELSKIPRGETRTYAEVAAGIGAPAATRAVAGACAANPLALAIPCHRVVRTDGSLSGYRWGVERKAKLLAAERKYPRQDSNL